MGEQRYFNPDVKMEHIDEAAVSPDLRGWLGALMADAFGVAEVREKAYWGTTQPVARVVAFEHGAVVGQVSLFRIQSDPPLLVFGLGDLAVDGATRRRGIARMLIRKSFELCQARGAEVVLGQSTVTHIVLGELGFVPVEIEAAAGPNWLAWSKTPLPTFRSLSPNSI